MACRGRTDDVGIDIVVDTAIEMLMTGCDLFVNKNDFTPEKVNAKESRNFIRNDILMGQRVALSWTSKKGFRLGVVFYGSQRGDTLSETFKSDTNTFIAQFDLDGIYSTIANSQKAITPDTIREVLSTKNDFSAWLLWPQFPSIYLQSKPPVMDADELAAAYEQWYQHSEPVWDEMLLEQSSLSAIRATYKGCKQNKSGDELFYRFSVAHEGKKETYHLIRYDDRLYLLDYTYDSVPLNHPLHKAILDACKLRMPRC
ncbi:hypothetical protein J7S78_13795 [Klebsiella oxytoca]|uniref:Uncharacterized protein n=1 Tax=Klebsiella oxytoca TaxID=571 RepID=A0AAP2FL62_KLEOX|nr:hypothetical protein [Klebsiella oxytoca]MBQ0600866.1 hypothetical protein [Klebsiella oxytoca]